MNYRSRTIVEKANELLRYVRPTHPEYAKAMKAVQSIVKSAASLDDDIVDLQSELNFLQDIVDRYPSYYWDEGDTYPDDDDD